MSEKVSKRCEYSLKLVRFSVILACLVGFLIQASEFMTLYWTYPTVVDIQQSEPSYLDIPAFTFCNSIGYNYDTICRGFDAHPCLPPSLNQNLSRTSCQDPNFGTACYNGQLPEDFQFIVYNKFAESVTITPKDHNRLRVGLDEYLECHIEFAGEKKSCNMDYVFGPFYSPDELPQYCYSIYSLWGNPEKERERIQKGAIMRLVFQLNASRSYEPEEKKIRPKHNVPSTPSVQLAVHSPYTLPTPFIEGSTFLAGHAYELRITMSERHLLKAPYQTNCTDYLSSWKNKNGKGPMNQLGVVSECKLHKYYEALGCVPLTVDYPHNYTLCKGCTNGCNYSIDTNECTRLAEAYNQPCDSLAYIVKKENKIITFVDRVENKYMRKAEGARWRLPHHNCTGNNFWFQRCSKIDIDVLFDRFEITNYTYNPKFESLEMFSVIGGYIGIYLGISLITVYDFLGSLLGLISEYTKRRRKVIPKKIDFPTRVVTHSNLRRRKLRH